MSVIRWLWLLRLEPKPKPPRMAPTLADNGITLGPILPPVETPWPSPPEPDEPIFISFTLAQLREARP